MNELLKGLENLLYETVQDDRVRPEHAGRTDLPGSSGERGGVPTLIDEQSAKFYGSILLHDISKKIRIPTFEEWVGINLLERDDELPARRG